MSSPMVSLLMSVYNGERYLREAIESILDQAFSDFEFIIVDDCSTDNTPEILKKYAKLDKRINLLHNNRNLGPFHSHNRSIKVACGKYLAILDADDVSLPRRLASQVRFLEEHPEVGVLGTWVAYLNENNRLTGIWQPHTLPSLVRWSMLFSNPLAHSSVMMRRSLVKSGVAYRPEVLYSGDYDLWFRLSEKTELANLPDFLCLRRVHKEMITARHYEQQEQTHITIMRQILLKLLGKDVPDRLITSFRKASKKELLDTGEELRAVTILIRNLYQAYVLHYGLSNEERKQVAEDASRRLMLLAMQHLVCRPITSFRVILQALCLNRRILPKSYIRKAVRAHAFRKKCSTFQAKAVKHDT